jgi:hypothetical protein
MHKTDILALFTEKEEKNVMECRAEPLFCELPEKLVIS